MFKLSVPVIFVVGTSLFIAVFEITTCSPAFLKTKAEEVQEFCQDEDFEARCLDKEVIAMTKATFGRMKVGRCLENEGRALLAQHGNDPDYFGCSADVIHIMDAKCAGRNHCVVRPVYDIDQKIEKPCMAALKSYLEASYECLTVVEPDRSCTVSVTSSAQHLMTSHSSSTKLSCGSRHQPWKLEAPAGQQINVRLLDFGGAVNQRERDCLQYGYIIDREAKKNISICGLINKRSGDVYQSKSNSLEVTVTVMSEAETVFLQSDRILVKVQAVGCTDVVPPEDMWLSRRNQEAVVGCYSSRQTWYLNCVKNQWNGVIGNCTRELVGAPAGNTVDQASSSDNTVLVVIAIVVIGLIICTIIVITGALCYKRYSALLSMKMHKLNINGNDWQKNSYRHNILAVDSNQN